LDYDSIGELAIFLIVAAGLESEAGVRNVSDRIVQTIGADNRTIDYQKLSDEREQRILRGH
jgi:hypothetical protein